MNLYRTLFELEQEKFETVLKNYDKTSIKEFDFIVILKDLVKGGTEKMFPKKELGLKHINTFLKTNAEYLLPYENLILKFWDKNKIETEELKITLN